MEIFIARQPIFTQDLSVFAYELFYREAGEETYSSNDGDMASSSVIAGNYLSQNFDSLMSKKKTFIQFTSKLLALDIMTLFPSDQLVVEILTIDDDIAVMIQSCKRIKELGYTIALGEFALTDEGLQLLPYADIVKVSLLNKTIKQIEMTIQPHLNKNIQFLAEKVESRSAYKIAQQFGYTYFQGFFFSKPEILQSEMVNASRVSIARLINAVNRPEPDFEELSEIIEIDSAFSYEMLKIANSAYFNSGQPIASIKQALVRLGLEEIKKWCYITVIRKKSGLKDNEILSFCMLRAKFMEQFAIDHGMKSQSSEFMTVGILSMIDVLTHSTMADVLAELALASTVKDTLLGLDTTSEMAQTYQLIQNCERGEWHKVAEYSKLTNRPMAEIAKLHHETIKWVLTFERSIT